MSRTFLLNKPAGKLMGVCAGISDYFGWDVTFVRIGFVLATVLGFGSAILVYLVIALLANSAA